MYFLKQNKIMLHIKKLNPKKLSSVKEPFYCANRFYGPGIWAKQRRYGLYLLHNIWTSTRRLKGWEGLKAEG